MSYHQVRLRPVTEGDLPEYVRWLNDPEVTAFTLRKFPGLTIEAEREWFARKTAPDCRDRPFAIEVDGRLIGQCELHVEESGQTAFYGIVIGDKTAWSQGYGTAAWLSRTSTPSACSSDGARPSTGPRHDTGSRIIST